MNRFTSVALFSISLIITLISTSCQKKQNVAEDYTGSKSCIECHEHFHELWSTSNHGLAMQPITKKFINNIVTLNQDPIHMEGGQYQAVVVDTSLVIREIKNDISTDYPILWALGGKNVYYFLTAIDGGRLQTLPLAFNVNTNLWYNNPESAIRHFPHMEQGNEMTDEALPWKHHQYTFNTSCYSCHVSQLSNNYDLSTNKYETDWKEVGINCETCHGPAGEHIKAARLAEKNGEELTPETMGLIMTSIFTQEQHNASCAPCHAKMRAITPSYMPGDKYFDNYDLITLENTDFYPDGRDLGENYTMTTWHQNPCIKKSELHCVTCHTSSGRYRFDKPDLKEANKACTSCHMDKEALYEEHTHHKIGDHSPKCIDCHMPMTTFGHMDRSDHSFRPPMPKATIEFQSPNACNLCHSEQDAAWSQKQLEDWGKDNGYQEETLDAGRLIVQARLNDWKNIDDILDAIKTDQYGEVFTTSLLRLLANNNDIIKKDAALIALKNESALVRSAAASSFYGITDDKEIKDALLSAAKDELRLVRLSAAVSLSLFPIDSFTPEELKTFNTAMDEYTNSLVTRPDNWSAHYNLGNHYQNLGDYNKAIQSYETSSNVYPEAVLPLVNSSFLYSISGNPVKAEENLKKALEVEPLNEAANFNYGLLLAELQRMPEAEKALRKVIEVNTKNAAAAYNLSIIVSSKNITEAIELSKMAAEADTENPKYGYTYAFFLNQNKEINKATTVLQKLLNSNPEYISGTFLLGQIYEQGGHKEKALKVYKQALKANTENQQAANQLNAYISRLSVN